MNKKWILAAAAVGFMAGSPAYADHHMGEKGEHFKEKMQEKFLENDTDGDGAISKAEFIAAHEKKFDEMDADNSGTLTKEEMKSAWDAKKEKMKDHHEKRMERKGHDASEGEEEKADD